MLVIVLLVVISIVWWVLLMDFRFIVFSGFVVVVG